MRLIWIGVLAILSVTAVSAQVAPPGILKEDCTKLKGKTKAQCETRNHVGEAASPKAETPSPTSDVPTGADADAPGEPPSPRPKQNGNAAAKAKPDTNDMPTGSDADPPASSMGPLHPDGTPDIDPPHGSSSSSSSSSSGSANHDDEDAAPTTAGGDSPVKSASLKDLGSHADTSVARANLEKNRMADDLKVGRFYLRDGNLSGAEARFKDALAHDPEDPDAHFAMAELLLKQKRNGEATAELQRYLQLAPDDDHTRDAKKMLSKLGKDSSH